MPSNRFLFPKYLSRICLVHSDMRVIIDFPLSFVSTGSSYFKALARSSSNDPMRNFVLWEKSKEAHDDQVKF